MIDVFLDSFLGVLGGCFVDVILDEVFILCLILEVEYDWVVVIYDFIEENSF